MSTNEPQPEYLGSAPTSADGSGPGSGRRARRTGIIVTAVVVVVAAVGAGAYAVGQLMSGGTSPASAVPAAAVAYASLDLDPSAAQKIEAVKILRKFPGLRSQLKISSRDDLRKTIFEQAVKGSGCTGVSYAADVKPWIGDRLAVAAVPKGSRILPLVLLQVSDHDKARAAVRALEACNPSDGLKGGSTGIAFVGDYMLLGEKKSDVAAMASSAESGSLEDDAQFKTWMGRTGDPGILTMYAAKGAAAAIEKGAKTGVTGGGSHSDGLVPGSAQQLHQAFSGFEGAAGVLRFKDGAVETEFTSKGLGKGVAGSGSGGPGVQSLPGTTAAALSVAFKPGWLNGYLDRIKQLSGGASSFEQMMRQGEQQTGLKLPQDIETLLGDGFDVSIDSGADLSKLTSSPDPSTIPAGIRIKGDATKITAVIDKLKKAAGPGADIVQVQSKGDLVAVGTDPAYVAKLLAKGDLGSTSAFTKVVPRADRTDGVLFVNFDAGNGWAERLADQLSGGDASVRDNVKPLDALGMSSWQDGDRVQHTLLRLTTD